MRGSFTLWLGVLGWLRRRGDIIGGFEWEGVAREALGLDIGVGLEVLDDDVSHGRGEMAGVDMIV